MVSEREYSSILHYCKKLFFYKRISSISCLSHFDLAHDVISEKSFQYEDYKKISYRLCMKLISEKIDTVPFEKVAERVFIIKIPCKLCENDYFSRDFNLTVKCCNRCYRLINKDRLTENLNRWRKNNPERVKELERKYRKKPLSSEMKAKRAAYKANWYQKNKQRVDKMARERKQKTKNENDNS